MAHAVVSIMEGLGSTSAPLLFLLLADNMTRTQAEINGNNEQSGNHATRLLIKIFAIQ